MHKFISAEMLQKEYGDLWRTWGLSSEWELQQAVLAYNAYYSLMMRFFIRELKLDEYDDVLTNWPEDHYPTPQEEMNLYAYAASGYLRFLYNRNRIHVERMTPEEKEQLSIWYRKKELGLNRQTSEFIRNTYQRILLEDAKREGMYAFYGPLSERYMAPSNAVVFAVTYEYPPDQEDSEAWLEAYNRGLHDIDILSTLLESREKQWNAVLLQFSAAARIRPLGKALIQGAEMAEQYALDVVFR